MALPPLVSVVIPCYNAAEFLAAAVRSVRSQGGPPNEVIIVDDGSSDDSLAVAEQLASDPAVRVVRRPLNGGPAAARNTGLRVAVGRYICFLDADDEYAPGFIPTASHILEADPTVAGLVAGIELLDCPRPVAPVQLDAIARSLPSNLLVRRAAVDLIGGFPEDSAFRGESAGEDIAFREALARHFCLVQTTHPFFKYRLRPGSHLDRFLDRTTVSNGQLLFKRSTADEQSGAFSTAIARYLAQVRDRFGILAAVGGPDGNASLTGHALRSVTEFNALNERHSTIPGFLDPREGYALYRVARDGLGQGAVVEIGSLMGRSTAWLAAGCRDARRGRVVAVDHFRGSPEHQSGGTHPIPELAVGGSTLPAFQANLARLGLADWVEPRVGNSVEIGDTWSGPIRLLFIDGDHSYEAARADWSVWSRHMIPGGVVGFHDINVFPEVTRFYEELRSSSPSVQEIGRAGSLRLIQLKQV